MQVNVVAISRMQHYSVTAVRCTGALCAPLIAQPDHLQLVCYPLLPAARICAIITVDRKYREQQARLGHLGLLCYIFPYTIGVSIINTNYIAIG